MRELQYWLIRFGVVTFLAILGAGIEGLLGMCFFPRAFSRSPDYWREQA